jgi:hypothetical protein
MSITAIIVIVVVVALVAVLVARRRCPRVTEITRTRRREEDGE